VERKNTGKIKIIVKMKFIFILQISSIHVQLFIHFINTYHRKVKKKNNSLEPPSQAREYCDVSLMAVSFPALLQRELSPL
jgi:hypothetical protein